MTASPMMVLHIGAGTIALLSGAAALYFQKGSRRHRVSGSVFFAFMLITAQTAVYLALLKPAALTVFNGMLAFYLAATSWITVKRKEGETGFIEWVALLAALAIAAGFLVNGVEAAHSVTGKKDGFPAMLYYIFGGITIFCATMDIRMILRGGIAGAQRIARHLWRMCFALWMAVTAFFLGQEKLFPSFIRETKIFYAPVILVTVLMIYWLVRTLYFNRSRRA